MPSSNISGLNSGLDTANIIQQLLSIQAGTQTKLKTRRGAEESFVKGLQELNSSIAALKNLASKFAKATSWVGLSATADDPAVTVKANSNAVQGETTFDVLSTARAHQLSFTDSAAMDDVVVIGGTTVDITFADGTTKTVDSGDGTLRGLINGINTSGSGIRATTLKLDDGTYRLSLTSSKTGEASEFDVSNVGGFTIRAGTDAAIQVDGDVLTSPTNTFADVIGGLTLTLGNADLVGKTVTVSANTDPAASKKQLKEVIDALNGVLGNIDKLNDKARTAGNSRASDSVVRNARTALLSSVYAGGAPLAELGVETDRTGKVVFNEAKFDAALAENPNIVGEKLGSGELFTSPRGYMDRLAAVANDISSAALGSLSNVIKNRQSGISDLGKQIDIWDDRLAASRIRLEKQFSGLEVAIGRLNSQSAFLAGQIAGLPRYSD